MNKQKLKNLIELVTFDQSLIKLEQQIKKSHSAIQELQHQVLQLEKQLELSSAKKRDFQKQLDDQELKVKILQEQEVHHQQLASSVTTPKEFEAIQKEMERLKLDRNHQEQRMMQMINKLNAAQKEYEIFQAQNSEENTKLKDLISHEKKAADDMQNQLTTLQQDRESKISQIPAEWLSVYETMRGKVSDPVVPINQESCSACFYFMSARDFQALKEQELLQCKDCYRFLYHEPTK